MSDGRGSVEEVREELKRLGYLQSGVDRWFLDDLGAGRSRFVRALRGAWRGSLPLGILGALASGIVVAGRNPTVGARPLDAVVLAAYLLIPAAVGAFVVLALVGAAGAGLLARRVDPGRLARGFSSTIAIAAGVVGVGFLAARVADPAALALEALLLASLALAAERVVHDELLALFVALEGIAPRGRRAGAFRLGVLIAGTVLGTTAIAASLAPSRPAEQPAPSLVVERRPGRVVVVAVDGFETASVDYFRERDRAPALAAFFEQAVEIPYRRAPASPPELWTTIWTGVSPELHGMRSYDWLRLPGVERTLVDLEPFQPVLRGLLVPVGLGEIGAATATERKAAAFWEIAARGGYPTLQVGCWGSGPAQPILGRSVSHRAPLLVRAGEVATGEVFPDTVEGPAREVAKSLASGIGDAEWIDGFDERLFAKLWQEERESVGIVYLPGLDLARNPPGPPSADHEAALLGRADEIERLYVALDAFIGEVVAGLDPQRDGLLLVGDPGRGSAREGVALFWGTLRPGKVAGEVASVDLLPTVLVRLGIPLSDELAGRPLGGASGTRVTRYARPEGNAAASPRDAAEYLKELRSLGYVQ